MSPLERWWLRKLLARQVRQGFDHPQRIRELYAEIRMACTREFYEDNKATRDEYLREWFEASL